MADNDPKVRIPVEMPAGDMEGAEKAKENIELIDEAAQEAQRQDDVRRAKELKAEREQAEELKKIEENTAEANRISRAKTAADISKRASEVAGLLRHLANDVGQFDKEAGESLGTVAKGFDGLTDAANGAAQGMALAGPLGAAGGALAGFLTGKLKESISDTIQAFKDLKTANDNAAKAEENYQKQLAERALAERQARVERFYDAQITKVERLVELLERAERLQASATGVDRAQRSAQNDAAVRGGADPTRVDANETARQFQEDIAASQKKVEDAGKIVAALEENAATLATKAKELEESSDSTQKQIDDAVAAAAQAREKAASAREELQETSQLEADAQEKLRIEMEKAFQGFADDIGDKVISNQEAQAAKTKEVVDLVDANNKGLSETQRQALERLREASADNKISAEEAKTLASDISTALTGLRTNVKAAREGQEGFKEILELMNENTRLLGVEQQALKRQVQELNFIIFGG